MQIKTKILPLLMTAMLGVSLGACSTVEGVKTDVSSLFSPRESVPTETIQLTTPLTPQPGVATGQPLPVIAEDGSVQLPSVDQIRYDDVASSMSSSDVELFSLDVPGETARQAVSPQPRAKPIDIQGVPSSTDSSVTVYPFTADMYTPGVKADRYMGVAPAPAAAPVQAVEKINLTDAIDLQPLTSGEPNRIYFEHGSAALNVAALEVIASVAKNYKEQILVEAHASQRASVADPLARAEVNLKMSLKRAMEVTRHLVLKGVPAEKIKTIAYGDTRPVAPESDPQSEALNRRVDVVAGK